MISSSTPTCDSLVIGAGAAGLMCSARLGQNGRSVVLLDHADKIGEKIRISGGGRCNFTNLNTTAHHFLSGNPHFCKSALSRYTPKDFVKLVSSYGIAYHEKAQGQLFCDDSATQIIDMLLSECAKADVKIHRSTQIHSVEKNPESGLFLCKTSRGDFLARTLVIATGGLSIPKIGATSFGYSIAKQFGLPVIDSRPALVPFTFDDALLKITQDLSGISIPDAAVQCGKVRFDDAVLFTHRGVSGPAILQISSYWSAGESIRINLCPSLDLLEHLKKMRSSSPKKQLRTILETALPERLAHAFAGLSGHDEQVANLSDAKLKHVADLIQNWTIIPSGTEGYRTAEVTAGGVDTRALSSKSMESNDIAGLYFIGEVVDVTGHLGGYNFQWAWSSAVCCADHIASQVSLAA